MFSSFKNIKKKKILPQFWFAFSTISFWTTFVFSVQLAKYVRKCMLIYHCLAVMERKIER